MSSISSPVQQVLQARSDVVRQQVDMALLKKSLDMTKQSGDAINQLLAEAVDVQRQIAGGHLDVKV